MADNRLLDLLCSFSSSRMSEFSQQNLTNTAWALANLQVLRVPLMLAIAGEAWRKSHELLPRSLANLAWSFASCAMYHQPLIDLISCRAIKLKQEFTS